VCGGECGGVAEKKSYNIEGSENSIKFTKLI
jgi:hypothetical protein